MNGSSVCAPASLTYYPSQIIRPAAAMQGQRVSVLIGSNEVTGSESGPVYIVTDQKDKKGNPLLVDRETGELASAGPGVVLALL